MCSVSLGYLERYSVAQESPIELSMYNRILGTCELPSILPSSAAAVGLSHNCRSIVEGVAVGKHLTCALFAHRLIQNISNNRINDVF